jgi:hypothetical protein
MNRFSSQLEELGFDTCFLQGVKNTLNNEFGIPVFARASIYC